MIRQLSYWTKSVCTDWPFAATLRPLASVVDSDRWGTGQSFANLFAFAAPRGSIAHHQSLPERSEMHRLRDNARELWMKIVQREDSSIEIVAQTVVVDPACLRKRGFSCIGLRQKPLDFEGGTKKVRATAPRTAEAIKAVICDHRVV